ncbi:hypothetical protein ACHAXT_001394 [Thalassiosira profunda]
MRLSLLAAALAALAAVADAQGGDGTTDFDTTPSPVAPGDTPAPIAPGDTAAPVAAPMDTPAPVAPGDDTLAPVAATPDTAAPVAATPDTAAPNAAADTAAPNAAADTAAPNAAPSEVQDPCPVCPDGLTADAATSLGGERTCATLLADAAAVDASGAECQQMLSVADSTCCPPGAENPCQVCVDGIAEGTEAVEAGAGKTCADLLVDALATEEEDAVCASMKQAESTCCPTAAEVPCPVCPDGITVDGTTTTVGTKTCDDLATDALNTEETDTLCTTLLGLQATCCPTPCAFCGNGTLRADATVGRETCQELADEALTLDTTRAECTALLVNEATCCPSPAAEPCPVCANGTVVESPETVEAAANGNTCQDLLDDALYVDVVVDAATCTAMLAGEALCCPVMPTMAPTNATVAPTVDVLNTTAPSPAPNANTTAPTVAVTTAATTTAPTMASTSMAEGVSQTLSPTPGTSATPSPVATPVTPSPVGSENLPPSGGQEPVPPSGAVASGVGSLVAFVVAGVWAAAFF